MVFAGTRADGSGRRYVVLKVLAEDSAELKILQELRDVPELCIVPVMKILPVFTKYRGRRMRAVCMPLLHSLAGAILDGTLPDADAVVADISQQLVQVCRICHGAHTPALRCHCCRHVGVTVASERVELGASFGTDIDCCRSSWRGTSTTTGWATSSLTTLCMINPHNTREARHRSSKFT